MNNQKIKSGTQKNNKMTIAAIRRSGTNSQ
jgi:hypothetical protein